MQCFKPLKVSSTGVVEMLEEEIVLKVQQGVAVYDQKGKTDKMNGIAKITNKRLFYSDSKGNNPVFIPLAWITNIKDDSSGFFKKSPKIAFYIDPKLAGVSMAPTDLFFRLTFKKSGKDDFEKEVKRALERKAWVVVEAVKKAEVFTTRSAGIAGIIRKRAAERKETKELATSAFSDLSSLIEKAKPVVALAQQYSKKAKSADESDKDASEFQSVAMSIGITSPVTKASAGALYLQELARQLAGFLEKPIEKAGGMVALVDLYCIYNRARGTDLISPDDMLEACRMMSGLGLPYTLRKFSSGVIVIQAASHSDEKIGERLVTLMQKDSKHRFVTAATLSKIWRISLMVAKELLLVAEKRLHICRDENIVDGLRFYPNLFIHPEYAI
eukprot:TRINITY_DN4243_c0_g1_i1.p1 TRINITY_DN4243_c0_g1~~TRINITY_DN4243_c0_g1_i1.p1  ORF type:complete len:386 (-),score=124.37 TRINITY_DN4243_c0_g1_i1:121-1278(-)